ncbi:MAG TPA: hypothetical protein VKE74_33025 [Gemmataceae bacterium]|nr:hypothetical protein [Gemmataceae bacterium]
MIAANEILSFYTTAGRVLIEGGAHALTSLVTLIGLWLSLEG